MIAHHDIQADLSRKIKEFFIRLGFDEEAGHIYTLDGKRLISVSKIVESFEKPKDWSKIANIVAPYRGTTGKKLYKNWEFEKDISIIQGHRVHKFGELLGKNARPPQSNQERGILNFWKAVPQDRYIRVAREVRMYHKKYFFSGTCDFLLYDTLTHRFIVGDYKTNKDLFKLYMNEKMLFPFDFLVNTPFSHYEIQLSLYDILISQLGIPVSERWIIWLMNDEKCKAKGLPVGSYKWYKVPDHKSTLLNWLNQRNNFFYNEQ